MVSKWVSNGLKVTNKYLRLPEGLTFDIKKSGDAIKKLEKKLDIVKNNS